MPASALAGRINCQGMQQILICVTRYTGSVENAIRGFYEIRRILIDIFFYHDSYIELLSIEYALTNEEYRIRKRVDVEIFLKDKRFTSEYSAIPDY